MRVHVLTFRPLVSLFLVVYQVNYNEVRCPNFADPSVLLSDQQLKDI